MLNGLNIQYIADKLEFDLDDVKMLIDVFVETAEETLVTLDKAIKNNDFENISLTSHSIKGSAANLLLDKIAEISKTLEVAANAKKQINYEELFLELSIEVKNLK